MHSETNSIIETKVVQELISYLGNTKTFGEVLQNLLDRHKYKQKDLAKASGWSKSEISRWKNDIIPKDFDVNEINNIVALLECNEEERELIARGFLYTTFNRILFKAELQEQAQDLTN